MPSLYASADSKGITASVLAWAMQLVYLEMPSWGACMKNEGVRGKRGNQSKLCSHRRQHIEEEMRDLMGLRKTLREKYSL